MQSLRNLLSSSSSASSAGAPPPLISRTLPAPSTHTYASPSNSAPLTLDLYLPPTATASPLTPAPSLSPTPIPCILYFPTTPSLLHPSAPSQRLISAFTEDVLTSGYAFISASHRLLVPCSGHDILADIHALFAYYHATLAPRYGLARHVVVAGHGAGGWVALQAALWARPRVVGVVLVGARGGMMGCEEYWGTEQDGDEAQLELEALEELRRRVEAEGVEGAGGTETEARVRLAALAHSTGTWLDLLTGQRGLSAALRAGRDVPAAHRVLFPELTMGAEARRFPPALVIHGRKDRTVLCEESKQLARRIRGMGGRAEIRCLKELGHAVSDVAYLRWMSADVVGFLGGVFREAAKAGGEEEGGMGEVEEVYEIMLDREYVKEEDPDLWPLL
ncbi:Alpha/Beta hydrolase protein [Geopyxis carbonaria]|nr:Alpha/Beta hydrolase protein [Geopyxis carbonaria]